MKFPFGPGRLAVALLCLVSFVSAATADERNPQISVIGDTRFHFSDAEGVDPNFEFEELEVAFIGPLNPYASAEVFVGVHGTDEVEIEEARLTLDRYLPAGLGVTAGHFLLDFGQLNPLHSHAYPWLDRPLMHMEFFGEDGAVDTGARLDWLAPTEGVTLRATVGAVRGDVVAGGHHHHDEGEGEGEEEAGDEEEVDPKLGVTGRVDLFADLSQDVSILIGGSVLHGESDPAEGAKGTFFGVDAKALFDLGPQRSLILNGEAMFGSLDATDEAAASDPNGFFAAADLRLNSRWNVGGFVESTTERLEDDVKTQRFGGFVGLALMEESTMFRVVGRQTDPDEGESVAEVVVQALFGLGPHRPHRF